MEMFRFILIIAGVAILALLYFSGRPKRGPLDQREALGTGTGGYETMGESHIVRDDTAFASVDGDENAVYQHGVYQQDDTGYPAVDAPAADPLLADPNARHGAQFGAQFGDMAQLDPEDFVRPGTGELQAEVAALETHPARTSIAQKIKAYSAALTPGRKQRIQAGSQQNGPSGEMGANGLSADGGDPGQSKIVSVHVVAPQGQVFNGAELYELFEQRGFHYGEMNIFHSMHSQKKMFSIAKMVEPGYFDINNIESFYTPGITLILQLPGPVAADVAFEVLISEARLLAQHLGGVVLGSDRSTLSNQSVAHMREEIVNYMHRQRFFSSVSG